MIAGPRPTSHRMPDGVLLRGLHWGVRKPRGTVLIRTPYDAAKHASTARSWNERGWSCLVQNVRGRYGSQGIWAPFTREGADGAATIAALQSEDAPGRIVLYGASYAAHTALEAVRLVRVGVAAVLVIVPVLGPAETAWSAAGEPYWEHRVGWWHEHGIGPRSRPALAPEESDRRVALLAAGHGDDALLRSWGWPGETIAAWNRLWAAPRVEVPTHLRGLRQPLLVISGDRDFFHADAQRLAAGWPGTSHLVSGPWGHELLSGITDPDLAAAIRSRGGLGAVIDPWLTSLEPPRPAAARERSLRYRSQFDISMSNWHHERYTL